MKCYPAYHVAGFFFGVNKSQDKRWVDAIRPLPEKALGKAVVLPDWKIRTVEEFLKKNFLL